MNGNEEAERVNILIKKLLQKHKVDADNAMEWRCFVRTVKSGLEPIEETARVSLSKLTEEMAHKISSTTTDYGKVVKTHENS